MGYMLAIDTAPITSAMTELGTAGTTVIAAGIAIAVGFFGLPFLWRKAKKTVGA